MPLLQQTVMHAGMLAVVQRTCGVLSVVVPLSIARCACGYLQHVFAIRTDFYSAAGSVKPALL
jgi:hypothetical protein